MAIKINNTTVIDDSRQFIPETISAGSTTGTSGQVLQSTGTGVAWADSRVVSISTNTSNQLNYIPYATSFGSTTGLGATTLLVYNPGAIRLGIGSTTPIGALDITVGSATTIRFSNAQIYADGGNNLFLGNNSITTTTNAIRNTVLGFSNDTNFASGSSQNTFVGYNNGGNHSGSTNIVLGSSNLGGTTAAANDNIAIGYAVFFQNNFAGFRNIGIGYQAAFTTTNVGMTASNNVILGTNAGYGLTSASNNVAIGHSALTGIRAGNQNIAIGQSTGIGITNSSQNVVIGFNQTVPILTGSNQLVIGSGNTSWINGNSAYNIGIGTTRPISKLHVVGDTLITGITTIGLGSTSTPPNNSQMSFELTSNTNLRIKVRDSSGVIRSADITLA